MNLAEIKTNPELSSYIECYWKYSMDKENTLTIFPDGTFNVILATHCFYLGNAKKKYECGVYLLPITLNPLYLNSKGSVYGIRFKAFSLNNVIGNKPQILGSVNKLDCNSILTNELKGKIHVHTSLESLTDCFGDLSFELLNRQFDLNSSLRDKVNYILDRRGNVKVSELCNEFSISRQGLHKYFKSHLGISPKELASTWKLNHFFTLLENSDSLTASALDAGYYDQAHSINVFKSKWDISPNSFKKNQKQLLDFAKNNMINRFNHYYDPISA